MEITPRIVGCLPRRLLASVAGFRRRYRFIERLSAPIVSGLRNRDFVIRAGVASGLVLNSGEYNLNYLLASAEPDVSEALKMVLAPQMTFYDVGANVGLYTLVGARIVGASGSVVSFEPLEVNRKLVEHNVRVNGFSNVHCLPYAVGQHDGEGKFMLSDTHSWGMLAGQGHVPVKFAGEILVDVRNLDGLINKLGLRPPDVIKIDVEGGETAVFRGAREIIAKYRPTLLVELHDTTAAVLEELGRQSYSSSLLGSSLPVGNVGGNIHIVAVPAEHPDRVAFIRRIQDSSFPRCERCSQVPATVPA